MHHVSETDTHIQHDDHRKSVLVDEQRASSYPPSRKRNVMSNHLKCKAGASSVTAQGWLELYKNHHYKVWIAQGCKQQNNVTVEGGAEPFVLTGSHSVTQFNMYNH